MNKKSSSRDSSHRAHSDHGRLQVADGAGNDLLYRSLTAREALSIIFRGEIADQRGNAETCRSRVSVFSRRAVFPEPGLDTRLTTKTPASRNRSAKRASYHVVLLQNVLPDFDQARFGAHSSPPGPLPEFFSLQNRLLACHIPRSKTICIECTGRCASQCRTKNQHGNFFHNKSRSFERRILACHFIGRKQRFLHHAGQETQA